MAQVFHTCDEMCVLEMPMFTDVITGALYIDDDPYTCIRFLNIRKVTRTEVIRFESIFSGRGAANIERAASGPLCGLEVGAAIKLEEKDHHSYDKYLKEEGQTEADARQTFRRRKIWYGVVDGRYRHEVLKMDNQVRKLVWVQVNEDASKIRTAYKSVQNVWKDALFATHAEFLYSVQFRGHAIWP